MKKIGILYICTGDYYVFWKDFYSSFEKNFLPNTEKHYFVFTDADTIYGEENNSRIHKNYIGFEPWPLPTLLKYKTFLSIEEELREMDYLYQSNANIVCEQIVEEKSFLPQGNGEELFFNIHPGLMEKKPQYCPFDRNPKSLAYVPYNKGKQYVFGAMNGGFSKAYLSMIKEIEERIEDDLKRGVIAKWHDESHVNHYVCTHSNYKLLSPAYCYPVGLDVAFPRIIVGVDKASKFDVNKLKGYATEQKKITIATFIIRKLGIIKINLLVLRDRLLRKRYA